MFFFVALTFSNIYSQNALIQEKLTEGQNFIIETKSDLFNHTVLIPNIENLSVNIVQGESSLGTSLGGRNVNGIVGYGQTPVKVVIQAKKDTTLEAYVAFYESEIVAPEMVIYTDPNFGMKVENPTNNMIFAGFFPATVYVQVQTVKQEQSSGWFSAVSYSSSVTSNMPVSFVQNGTHSVSIHTMPLSRSIFGTQQSAHIFGTKNGALIKLAAHEITFPQTETDEGNEPEKPSKPERPSKPEKPSKPGKPSKPEKPCKPSKPGTSYTPYQRQDYNSYSDYSDSFAGIQRFCTFLLGMGIMALIFGIVKACKNCRREDQAENEQTIPPVAPAPAPTQQRPTAVVVQPVSNPYEQAPSPAPAPASAPKQQKARPAANPYAAENNNYPASAAIYVYPQVNVAYPEV